MKKSGHFWVVIIAVIFASTTGLRYMISHLHFCRSRSRNGSSRCGDLCRKGLKINLLLALTDCGTINRRAAGSSSSSSSLRCGFRSCHCERIFSIRGVHCDHWKWKTPSLDRGRPRPFLPPPMSSDGYRLQQQQQKNKDKVPIRRGKRGGEGSENKVTTNNSSSSNSSHHHHHRAREGNNF